MGRNRLQFRTKRDKNGNSVTLVIDLTSKQYSVNNHWINEEFIPVTKKAIRQMIRTLLDAGYKVL